MAGRSIEFRGVDVPFYKSGSDKMVISSPAFLFHGLTLIPTVSNCYVLNDEGTAFQYTTAKKTMKPLTSYFTTNLSDEERPDSIELPNLEELKNQLSEQEDAIRSLTPTLSKGAGAIYDLSGRQLVNSSTRQLVNSLKKGLYIIDGKKVLIK